MNTEITYLYRDADNYKQGNTVVVQGELTFEQIEPYLEEVKSVLKTCNGDGLKRDLAFLRTPTMFSASWTTPALNRLRMSRRSRSLRTSFLIAFEQRMGSGMLRPAQTRWEFKWQQSQNKHCSI